MGRFKGGGLLLILSGPLALYAVWQVNGVVRTDLVLAEPPADRGPTKEQLAETSKKVVGWSAEVRKATGFAEQFRPDAAGSPARTRTPTPSSRRPPCVRPSWTISTSSFPT